MTKPKSSKPAKRSVRRKSLWLKERKKWSPLTIYPTDGYEEGKGAVTYFYWRLTAKNGRVVCDGSEGYSSEAKAHQGFRAAAKLAARALEEMER